MADIAKLIEAFKNIGQNYDADIKENQDIKRNQENINVNLNGNNNFNNTQDNNLQKKENQKDINYFNSLKDLTYSRPKIEINETLPDKSEFLKYIGGVSEEQIQDSGIVQPYTFKPTGIKKFDEILERDGGITPLRHWLWTRVYGVKIEPIKNPDYTRGILKLSNTSRSDQMMIDSNVLLENAKALIGELGHIQGKSGALNQIRDYLGGKLTLGSLDKDVQKFGSVILNISNALDKIYKGKASVGGASEFKKDLAGALLQSPDNVFNALRGHLVSPLARLQTNLFLRNAHGLPIDPQVAENFVGFKKLLDSGVDRYNGNEEKINSFIRFK